jgi:hypothetical protein
VTSEGWHCVFCSNSSRKPADEERYEFSMPSHPVEYIEARNSSSMATLISDNDDSSSLPRSYVFLLDTNIPHEEFQVIDLLLFSSFLLTLYSSLSTFRLYLHPSLLSL